MAADGGRLRTAQPAQACAMCKTRKKKCSKALPSCGYCTRKDLECVYAWYNVAPVVEKTHDAPVWRARPPLNCIGSRTILDTNSPSDRSTAEPQQGQVYLEVHNIIRATGQFVDDISSRYFKGFHRHLPVISRTRFYNNLVALGAAPAADFSVLLLTICLITHAPALGYQSVHAIRQSTEQQSLYLTARSLLAQVQVSCSPSASLIQASLLLSVYEYTHSRPDDAFVTIAGSARMASAAGIRVPSRHDTWMAQLVDRNADTDFILQAEEATNTWWGLVICERTFFSEANVPDQPLLTAFPNGDARLPIEPIVLDQLELSALDSLPNVPVSCLTSPKLGGFSRTAQATSLLDQVLRAFQTTDIESRFLMLDRLNTSVIAFLSLVMPQCQGQLGAFCAAINIAIRGLFTLHGHILDQHPQAVRAKFQTLDEWHRRSREALDTATKMVVETAASLIAPSPENSTTHMMDVMPPVYLYTARAALKYIRGSIQKEDASWLSDAEEVIQTSLEVYFRRWSVGDWTQNNLNAER